VQSVLNARKPPGATLRYHGRLYCPLSLPPYLKAFMAFLGFWQTASLRTAIVLLNWSPAQRCQRSTNPPVEAFFWEPTTGTIMLI
jgi:hypothetical protein